MTRVLVWKELREQWPAWLALTLAAAGGVAALAALLAPGTGRDEVLAGTLWLAAWGYGVVCGALVLAGEAEGGTQEFLDALPATRHRLWLAKAGTGLALLAAQAAALAAVGLAVSRRTSVHDRTAVDVIGVLLSAAVGYAWGLTCGASAASVLGAVARAVLLQAVWCVALFPVVALTLCVCLWPERPAVEPAALVAALGVVGAGAAVRSQAAYCRPDRRRGPATDGQGAVRPGVGELVRVAWRRARWFAVGMAVLGGLGAAAVALLGVVVWPAVTLLAGVLCGVTASAGRERPATGRALFVRAVVRFAIALGTATLAAMSPIVIVVAKLEAGSSTDVLDLVPRIHDSVATDLVTQPVTFLALWVVCGYAVGLLSGLVVRRPLAATVVAVVLAAPFGGVWVPSVFVGGPLYAWQAWGAPALLLAASFWLMRPAAGDRPSPVRTAGVAATAVVVAGLWQIVALGYRAEEIPVAPDALDVDAYRASLPTPEQNEGGRLTLDALTRLVEVQLTFVSDEPPPGPPRLRVSGTQPPRGARFFDYLTRVTDALERGWPADDRPLAAFVDLMANDAWARDLARAAELPAGVVADPREMVFLSLRDQLQAAEFAATLLAARGLQRQAEGDPAAFLASLKTGLALARNLRHRTVSLSVLRSRNVEARLEEGLERWLDRLDGRPDLLRRALDAHLDSLRDPPTDEEIRQAEFLVTLNTFADPVNVPASRGATDPFFFRLPPNEGYAFRWSWQTPWEAQRLRRALGGMASDDRDVQRVADRLAPPLVRDSFVILNQTRGRRPGYRTDWWAAHAPAAALQVALRLYHEETGRPAERLEELVPKYLPAVPADPFDGQPFRYRLSRGERIQWSYQYFADGLHRPGPRYHEVAAGRGVLWSVGEDRRDDGGHLQRGGKMAGTETGEDVIFLVPLPPGRR